MNTKNKLLEIATNIFKVLGSAENLSKITISEDEKENSTKMVIMSLSFVLLYNELKYLFLL